MAFVEAVVGAGLATVFLSAHAVRHGAERYCHRSSSAADCRPHRGYRCLDCCCYTQPTTCRRLEIRARRPSVHVSPYYLENSLAETQTSNVVNRCANGLSRPGHSHGDGRNLYGRHRLLAGAEEEGRMIQSPHDSVIVRRSGEFLIPLVQLFGLYVLFFGQYGPGGGFVGGVMLGASLIAGMLIFGFDGQPAALARKVLKGGRPGADYLRGLRGIVLDRRRRVLKLLTPTGTGPRRSNATPSGHHRGSDRRCDRYCGGRDLDCFQFVRCQSRRGTQCLN